MARKWKGKKDKGKTRQDKGGFVAVSTVIYIIHNTISFFTSIYILFRFLLIIMGMCGKKDCSLNNGLKKFFQLLNLHWQNLLFNVMEINR